MSETADTARLLDLTAQIVAAHLANNPLPGAEIPALIASVHRSLAGLGQAPAEPERLEPAVPVKKSVFPDYIVCLEDGKKLKMLKRHLKTAYNLTPEQYREKWGLSREYPMVAPNYAERRSTLAKKIGLGHRPAAAPEPQPASRPARRGRKPSAA
jgi:predicted transcriptional regulator